jgi:hypothetical protein
VKLPELKVLKSRNGDPNRGEKPEGKPPPRASDPQTKGESHRQESESQEGKPNWADHIEVIRDSQRSPGQLQEWWWVLKAAIDVAFEVLDSGVTPGIRIVGGRTVRVIVDVRLALVVQVSGIDVG